MSLTERFTSLSSDNPDQRTIFHGGVPVLHFYQGLGAPLPDEALQAIKLNVTSILNGDVPAATAAVDAQSSLWQVVGPGHIRAQFSLGDAHNDRMSVYMGIHGTCPPEKAALVRSILTGGHRDAMAQALRLVTLAGAKEFRKHAKVAPPSPYSG